MTARRTTTRVYLYWRREQCFSPEDARLMVAAYLARVA